MLASRCMPCISDAPRSRHAMAGLPGPKPRQARPWGSSGGSGTRSSAAVQRCLVDSGAQRLMPTPAASDSSAIEATSTAGAGADELPLWRFLRQQGFSDACIGCLQAAASSSKTKGRGQLGNHTTEQKLQHDLAPNVAALGAEGLDTASIERLFLQRRELLTVTHATFSSSLAALRQLTALLPDYPLAVQAPAAATQLGVALWRFPTGAAYLLSRTNLASLIERNLRLRRQLGISDAATATALFQSQGALVSKFERAEVMVAHLQRLQASGELSAEQVARMALAPSALHLTPAEFDRRWHDGGLSRPGASPTDITMSDTAGRQQAAAAALGELLQAADGVPGPLQPQYLQQGEELVQRSAGLWRAGPAALRAGWASLQQLGLSDSQVVAAMTMQPAVLSLDWAGETKQRLLAWAEEHLGIDTFGFLTSYTRFVTYSGASVAMRADFLQQHHPAMWDQNLCRGPRTLFRLLTEPERLCAHAGCTETELVAFNRAWLATPAGLRWGGKAGRSQRRAAS